MTKTLIEQLEAAIDLAEQLAKERAADVTRLKLELAHARAAQAAHDGHVWAGKQVRRTERQRGSFKGLGFSARNPDRIVTLRGTVTLALSDANYCYRGHYPKAGEWFVKSKSGQTAYALGEGWELDE